ncbi:MAG: YHS domain-containing (seleno)protein [Verrucomicrobiota bacterium]
MKTILLAAIAPLLLTFGALADHDVNVAKDSGVALEGHDPVAFFTEGKPVEGSSDITAEYHGAVYHFASEESRSTFQENPEAYAPQYGGFCAFGVTKGKLLPVEIDTWQIVDGKLYLNLNSDVQSTFNKALEKNIEKADEKWAGIAHKG